jgi:anion-transporting  ArsA/GET3 family ATPase
VTAFADALEGATVVVCAGPGGVGKTTVSAALALGLAARGRRVAVVTIDPARRLADALGLDRLENHPTRVDARTLAAAGIEVRGELWAMMLDAKRTFDELVERLAPDTHTRDEILANRVYGELSTAVGGSQEYTAMAKLHELVAEDRFDVIVLDTAPSRNAIDFLETPDRLLAFLDGRAARTLLAPGALTARVAGTGAGVALTLLRRVTGVELLDDVQVFLHATSGLMGAFGEQARQVRDLLSAPGTRGVLVTAPRTAADRETGDLAARLDQAGMAVAGVVVNRVHPLAPGDDDPAVVARRLEAVLGPSLAQQVARRHGDLQRLARRDAAEVGRVTARLPGVPLVSVADTAGDVHDLRALRAISAQLLPQAGASVSAPAQG